MVCATCWVSVSIPRPALAISALALIASGLSAQTPVSIRADDGGVITADGYGSGYRGVVLAHGGRFDRTSWRDQAEELAVAGFRVVAIDFRASVEARA
jgi:pimeloyl-ACP methyl ester carboxylesterase